MASKNHNILHWCF